jgi:hypothetical protein
LIKEAGADGFMRNKFGYTPSDIAQNFEIRKLFCNLLQLSMVSSGSLIEEQKQMSASFINYGRTAVNGSLRHNDRVNSVQKLMSTF